MTANKGPKGPWFAPIFRATRPGSRTVLCDLAESECALEFARRGYRLLLLNRHPTEVRQALREAGLSSLLMGSQLYTEERLSLAKAFYELVVFCGPPPVTAAQVEPCLKPQATVIWGEGLYIPDRQVEELDLPAGLRGIRYC